MRALLSLLIIQLLIQLPGPSQWQPVQLVPAWAGEAQLRMLDPSGDRRIPLTVADLDEQVIRVPLLEDDVVHDDMLPDSIPFVSAAMRLRSCPPEEPHLELDLRPPQGARLTRAPLAS